MSNISNFISSFKTEAARSCNFDVNIYPTSLNLISSLALASGKAGTDPVSAFRNISMRCEAAELPSRSFSTVDHKIYGPVHPHPIQTTYSKLNLTFLCSDDMSEKFIFDAWMNYMSNASFFPFPSSAGQVIDLFKTGGRPVVNYDFEYKNNYESLIVVTQYGMHGEPTLYSALFHAFPISVNELGLNWRNTDDIHKLTVTFAYTYHNTAIKPGSFPIPLI
jgi:hypothetical protein